jgi:SAM-dependent methyltransferase
MDILKSIKDNLNYSLFLINGKKPWSRGYSVYKERQVQKVLDQKEFDVNLLKRNYGLRLDERVIEYPWLFSQLPDHGGYLLDAGSALNHKFLLSREILESKHIFISTLAPETNCFWRRSISYIYEDLRDTCYKDGFFDWVVCISTLEHIGLNNTMLYTSDELKNENSPDSYLKAVREYYRVLKKGGTLFLSFPFGKHVNHGWFQVFNNEMLDSVIATFSPDSITEFHYRYENNGWQVSSREDSQDATYFDINKQKKYDADYAAASRAIVCLKMVK